MTNFKALQERKHVWRDEFVLILSLIVFVGVVYALDSALKPVFTTSTLLLAGVFLALVPASIWLVFFYIQDRVEPEPKHFVLGIFVLGALLAAAVGIPLVENVFRTSHWLYGTTLTTILGGFLVVGFTQEFLKYAAVRYSIYHSDEFDEPTDGVIYATAAGLGYATVLNIQFVVSNGGVDLGTGVIRMAVVALAQASFSGITGYFLGRAKFESEQIWWMPLGITLASVFNGLFNWLRGRVAQTGISLSGSSSNTWLGLVLAAVIAFATTGIVLWLVRRHTKSIQARQENVTVTNMKPSLGDRYAEITVVAVTVIALLAGWSYKSGVESRSVAFESEGVSAAVPDGWLQSQAEGNLIRATDRTSSGFATTYAISKLAVAADITPAEASSFQTLDRSEELTGFRVLNQQSVLVNGQDAYQVTYVFVDYNPNVTNADIPSVVRGVDYTFVKNGQAITVSYWADEHEFEAGMNLFNRFLSSVKF